MKKNLLWLLFPAIVAILLMPAMAQAQQRLTNGGFETWTAGPGGPPDNWVYGTRHVTGIQETSRIRSGSYATKVLFDSTGTLQFNTTSISVVPGQTYSCSLYVWDDYSLPGNCRMRPWFFFSPTGSGGPSTYSVDTAGYKLYVYSMAAPTGAVSLTLQMRIYGGAVGRVDSFWIDDVGLYGPVPNMLPTVGAPIRVPAGLVYAATDINANSLISDSDGTIVSDSLYIDLSGGGYNPVAHDSIDGGGNYWYHIGAHPVGTVVTYYAVATDNGGGRTVGSSDTYTVLPNENIPPTVGTPVRVPSGSIVPSTFVYAYSLISDADGTITSDSLYIDLNSGGFNPVAHDSVDAGGNYWYSIGTHVSGTVVTYYAVATDNSGARVASATDTYTVLSNSLPTIGTLVRLPAGKLFYDHYVTVHAPITDLDGTIVSDNMYLQIDGGGYIPVAHDSIDASNNYWYTIGTRAAGTIVDYYISATDNFGDGVQSATFTYTVHGNVPISTVQYSSGSGSLPNCYPTDSIGTNQEITGIVVGRYGGSASNHRRAFVQDSTDPWSGIYVYSLPDTVLIGDMITVRDSVSEYFAETEMLPPVKLFTKHSSGNPLPAYTILNCAQYAADSCGLLQESYEGMLIQINNVTLVDTFPKFGSNRGDFWGVDGTGDTCVVANDLSTGNGADSCVFQVGHTYTWIRGVARYTYGRYRIMPMYTWDLYTAPGTISGIVYGPDGSTPLEGVTVNTLDASEVIVGTNISGFDGTWSLDVAPGIYHEQLSKAGYVDTSIANIVVTQGATTNVNTSMRAQVIVCTGDNIFTIKNSLTPGPDTASCWPSPYAGQVKSVCGIVTAVRQATFFNYYIQDQSNTAWGAVYGYDYTLPDGTPITAHLGDYVQVTSKVSEYWGWTELDSLINYTVISTNQPLPDTIDVNVATFTPAECDYLAEPYESELVKFTNVTIRSAQGTSKFWFTDASTGDSIRIANDLWIGGTSLPSPLPATGMTYDRLVGVMRWEGRNGGSNIRGWILLPRFETDFHQLIIPEPNIAEVWPIDNNTLAVTFDRAMDPVSIANPSYYSTVRGLGIISAAASGNRKAILTTATQPNDLVDSLVVNGVCDSTGNCMITPHQKLFHSGITSISVMQTPDNGGDATIWLNDIFTIRGVVTSDSSTSQPSNIYLSDQSGPPYRGIHAYVGGVPGYRPFIGDTIVATGIAAEYFQETEISNVSNYGNMQIISTAGPDPTPYHTTTSQLLANGEYFESDLVTVCDSFTVTNTNLDGYGWVIYSISNPAESLIVDKNGLWTRYTYVPVIGDIIRGITGIYKFDRSKFRISPRTNADLNSFDTWCGAGGPIIGVAPASINHTQETDISRLFTGDFTISNTGTLPLSFTAGNTLPWIILGATAGDILPGGNMPIDLTVNTTGIVVGLYNDVITINSNDPVTPEVTVPVTITVSQIGLNVDHFDIEIIEGQMTTVDLIVSNGSNADVHVTLAAIPVEWLSVDPTEAIIPPLGSLTAHVHVDATALGQGNYNGSVTVSSNNLVATIFEVPINLIVNGAGGCSYVVGDVNDNGVFNGIDVGYGVNYLKGGTPPPYSCECTTGNTWFVAGDVNGTCSFNGIDVTYMVNYFKGGAGPIPCASCPPVVSAKIGIVNPTSVAQPINGEQVGQ